MIDLKNKYFSSFRGIFNQAYIKNNFFVYKKNNEFFRINMTVKHIKFRKYINYAIYSLFIIYYLFIWDFYSKYNFFINCIITLFLNSIIIYFLTFVKAFYEYKYCKKMMKENKGELFEDIDIINEFYGKRKR